jgi:hypothetical protein
LFPCGHALLPLHHLPAPFSVAPPTQPLLRDETQNLSHAETLARRHNRRRRKCG